MLLLKGCKGSSFGVAPPPRALRRDATTQKLVKAAMVRGLSCPALFTSSSRHVKRVLGMLRAGALTASPCTHREGCPPSRSVSRQGAPAHPGPRIHHATCRTRRGWYMSNRTESFSTRRPSGELHVPGSRHNTPWMRAAAGGGGRTHVVRPCCTSAGPSCATPQREEPNQCS